jgi:hypothetical protein
VLFSLLTGDENTHTHATQHNTNFFVRCVGSRKVSARRIRGLKISMTLSLYCKVSPMLVSTESLLVGPEDTTVSNSKRGYRTLYVHHTTMRRLCCLPSWREHFITSTMRAFMPAISRDYVVSIQGGRVFAVAMAKRGSPLTDFIQSVVVCGDSIIIIGIHHHSRRSWSRSSSNA